MSPARSDRQQSEDILARIDREIDQLLRTGKLSPLEYDLPVDQAAKTNRRANLKALLAARRHYRHQTTEAKSDAD